MPNKGRIQSNAYTAYLNQRRGQTNGVNQNTATTNRPGVAPEAVAPSVPLVQGQRKSLGGRPTDATPGSTAVVVTDILTIGQVSPGQTVQFTVGAVSPEGAVRLTEPVVLGEGATPQGA
jgi:hypothetical protein